ncbi:hypothetical protein [Peptostreptococcus porci]|uniref:hypothetical protein n=1 Tax=Peptostreptococcus porci TaxID=2652282 RepID=UPI002A80634C|nr:hypothetical protein [Peptostreptococcus porci]MDY4127749.1 hypothetical protein [Peptostreptococcus porci]
MKVGDKIEIIKDNCANNQFIGLTGKVEVILDSVGLNIGVSFEENDNKEYLNLFPMLKGRIIYFDINELNVISK